MRRRGDLWRAALACVAVMSCALICVAPGLSAADAVFEPDRGGPWPPMTERLVSDLSRDSVPISVVFNGSEISVYGAVRRDRFLEAEEPAPGVIISVTGPAAPVIVRRKQRVMGVWTNRFSLRIASAPSYYAVASTQPLESMLRRSVLESARLRVEDVVRFAGLPQSVNNPEDFHAAVVRIRAADGLYREDVVDATGAPAVKMVEGALFHAVFDLPANITEGDFEVRVVLVRNGHIVDDPSERRTVRVRLSGVDRQIYTLAQTYPLLYGLGAVLAALAAGWLAAEGFQTIAALGRIDE